MVAVPILLGRYFSPYVRRVAVSLRVLGIAYEHRTISSSSQQEELRRINPVGRVPAVIIEGGEILIESSAILDYFDYLVGPERALTPANDPDRRRVQYAIAVMLGSVEKFAATLYERSRRPPEKIHLPWIDHCLSQAASGLEALESLMDRNWVAGPQLTQADVTTLVGLDFIRRTGNQTMPLERYPLLLSFLERHRGNPALVETLPDD